MIINDKAIVLSLKKTAELDLNISLYCLKLGKIYAKAKGASKITSSRLSTLQAGNTVQVFIHEKNSIHWISQTKPISSFLTKSKSLTQMNLLFYLLELCYRIIPASQPNNLVFSQIEEAIQAIDNNQIGKFIQKEINIVNLLGYGTPVSVSQAVANLDAKQAHHLLKNYIESILERPLESQKLFS